MIPALAYTTQLVPNIQQLQLTVAAGRRRHGYAAIACEQAWSAYAAAVDAGDPSASVLGDLAEAFEAERLDAWKLMDAAEAQLLAMWS